jgi:hypothetical protein
MKQTKFPDGWDAERVRRVLEHYEAQSDEEAVAEDEPPMRRPPRPPWRCPSSWYRWSAS